MKLQSVRQNLHTGWVIANHILVSFHVAFISSILSIPNDVFGTAVLRFVFVSPETIISALFWLISFHTGIAVHEMGHYIRAVKVNALDESLLPEALSRMRQNIVNRIVWYLGMFLLIPYGKFRGVRKEGLTYYPDAPFNLSVAAAGPKASRTLSVCMLPLALIFLALGLSTHYDVLIYCGRLCLGIGCVGLLDYLLADPGKFKEFKEREAHAAARARTVEVPVDSWLSRVKKVKEMMKTTRIQEITLPNKEKLRAPWQFRNCGMGGRHTEKEYPESNISYQELMFVPLCAKNYEEAQMITVLLQNRFKEIIENEQGARVMGIGLEGGLAPFVSKAQEDSVPEERVWRMAVRTIKDSGFVPGKDIVIAFDHASSELSNAYREEYKQADSKGMYYFWRSEEKTTMSREQMLDLCKHALEKLPVVSYEDAFAEDDHEGWRLLMEECGDKVFIIGDDLVTTKDSAIEECADKKLINTVLIKANQIGTLSETMLAMLVALGKGLEIVVSHRSKSPNDDMEAQIALAVNALGLKTGGGANTERLVKYGAVTKVMKDMEKNVQRMPPQDRAGRLGALINDLAITDIIGYEEPTNAGIPTVGIEVHVGVPGDPVYRRLMRFTGSTPLGTSAGSGEAIHLVDSVIERCAVVERHAALFVEQPDKTFTFRKNLDKSNIEQINDPELTTLWQKTQRYDGKGCQNAVSNVVDIIAPHFVGVKVATLKTILELDKTLLSLEKEVARARGKLSEDADLETCIEIMQRKANLGMNAILSVSLAIARLIAHVHGKDLWQLVREEMKAVMAKTLVEFNEREILQDIAPAFISRFASGEIISWGMLADGLTFEELVKGLQKVEKKLKTQHTKLHIVLRKHMPLYA